MVIMTRWCTVAGAKGHTGPGFKLPGSLKDLPAEVNFPEMGKIVEQRKAQGSKRGRPGQIAEGNPKLPSPQAVPEEPPSLQLVTCSLYLCLYVACHKSYTLESRQECLSIRMYKEICSFRFSWVLLWPQGFSFYHGKHSHTDLLPVFRDC